MGRRAWVGRSHLREVEVVVVAVGRPGGWIRRHRCCGRGDCRYHVRQRVVERKEEAVVAVGQRHCQGVSFSPKCWESVGLGEREREWVR